MSENILWSERKRWTFFGLPWTFTKYLLSEDRFFVRSGLINQKEDEVRLYRVTDVSLNRTLGQRIFGLGTIHCCSADKSMGDFNIINIRNSRNVKEQMSQLVETERQRHRVYTRENMVDVVDDDPDDDPNN